MNCFTLLTLVLLAGAAGADLPRNLVELNKCCGAYQMLSADGRSCEGADWPRNFSIKIRDTGYGVEPPLDSEWVRRWLPPGPAMNVSFVKLRVNQLNVFNLGISVNSTSLFNPVVHRDEELSWSSAAFLPGRFYVARPKPRGGYREAHFCIDAAPPPMGPFVMKYRTKCNKEECPIKCCRGSQVMQDDNGHWGCGGKVGPDSWRPRKSSLAAFDPEFPFVEGYSLCESPRLLPLPLEERYAYWLRDFHFSTWVTCVDFFRSGNASLKEGFFHCEYPQIASGVYWLLRPLCVLSALLLTASLLSVACNKTMRRNTHGRCLATHAACLLAFNVGQIWYYLAVSDRLNAEDNQRIPPDLQIVCKSIALSMYFVLTASWFWLTALCANMACGFRLQMPRLDKGSGKKFLAISAFAWGLPAVLTIACGILFTQPNLNKPIPWYSPSLMETRVCYVERIYLRNYGNG